MFGFLNSFPGRSDEFNEGWKRLREICPSLSSGDYQAYVDEVAYWVRRDRSPLASYEEFANNPDPLKIGEAYLLRDFSGGRG